VGQGNPEGQLIFKQGSTTATGNTLMYANPGYMGNCNKGSYNTYGNYNQGNNINTNTSPYG